MIQGIAASPNPIHNFTNLYEKSHAEMDWLVRGKGVCVGSQLALRVIQYYVISNFEKRNE